MQSGSAQRGSVWLTSTATVISAGEMSTAQPAQMQPVQLMTVGWALRRAALGLTILLVATGFCAWLWYASIEDDGTTGPGAQSEYALPQG